ncbi:hypothetical protein Vadar_007147 [Vaccinium darrowii]|uniref:Uncharacterized protein n=1 Tax=Vaccinium darrowii TaxID=229202 RepID=A0ACB7X817_9ERIC|nr:hypothetical protein Vadar_007147 [Vaccinium darrowii]
MQANTDADNSMKRRLISSTGKKWREWKCTVRRLHYKAFTNDPERLAHRPERVNEHQWRALVYYWGTRKAQETVKNKGVPASRMQVWKASYLKDNMPASDAVNEVVTQMTELSTQREGSTESTCIDEEIFAQVMGPERPGRVRTYGLGPSITDVFGGGYRRSHEQTQIFQAQLQEQFQLYQVQFETQMKEMMETQLETMRAQMQSQAATIQAQATTIQAQQARMELLESKLGTKGGPARNSTASLQPVQSQQSAALGHPPMSRPQQNTYEFTSSSNRPKHDIIKRKKEAAELTATNPNTDAFQAPSTSADGHVAGGNFKTLV